MIQTIDFAPLDGITKIVFRQVWSQFFGGVDRYFIPFFSPTPHHLMTPRALREVEMCIRDSSGGALCVGAAERKVILC